MSPTKAQSLDAASETSLMAVYIRAKESQRPDALIRDEKAMALVADRSEDFARFAQVPMSDALMVMRNLATREYDRQARDFLVRHPDAVVVHIGCGLDSRFERVDNGRVEWYDLDLPEVIELRRKLFGDEGKRHHLLGCSALEEAWLESVSAHRRHPFLFLAEVVLVYLDGAQVKRLVHALRESFPGAELVFDAFSPFLIWMNNLRISRTKIGARYRWGLKRSKDLESWGAGICLLDEWFPFSRPEPRLAYVRWMRHVPLLARVMGIFHYRLG